MELDSVLVTGAARGIGLEFVRQLINLPKPPRIIFATYRERNTTQELKVIRDTVKNCQVLLIKMDVTKPNEIESARKIVQDMVGEKGLNLLINNAAVRISQGFPEVTEENMMKHYAANSVGPVSVAREMMPLLKLAADRDQNSGRMSVSKAAVINISSIGGSLTIADDKLGPRFLDGFSYKMSKAALNMAMRVIAVKVKDQGILVVLMCPGWVKTDMGSDQAELEVSACVSSLMKTFARLDETHHATFINRNGEPIPF